MAVPDQIPETHKEPSEEMKHSRALKVVRENLVMAVRRLNEFLADKSHDEVIRRIHTAKTEIRNDSDDPELITYYTLWTDFGDMRLTQDGQLLRSDYYDEKYSDITRYGADKSVIVSTYDLRTKYKTNQLLSLAHQLEKFLKPKEELIE